ncbi:hypothetical protein HDU86_003639 [Geranomyces michiganensis]|nr:hypothetical protein HDU86_003639 [Geranomyces michiganensis]
MEAHGAPSAAELYATAVAAAAHKYGTFTPDRNAFNPFPHMVIPTHTTVEHQRNLVELRFSFAWRICAHETEEDAIAERFERSAELERAASDRILAETLVKDPAHMEWRQRYDIPTRTQPSLDPWRDLRSFPFKPPPPRRPPSVMTRSAKKKLVAQGLLLANEQRQYNQQQNQPVDAQPLTKTQRKKRNKQLTEQAVAFNMQQAVANMQRHALPPNPFSLEPQLSRKQKRALAANSVPHDSSGDLANRVDEPIIKEEGVISSSELSKSADPPRKRPRVQKYVFRDDVPPSDGGLHTDLAKPPPQKTTETPPVPMIVDPVSNEADQLEEGEIPADQPDDHSRAAASEVDPGRPTLFVNFQINTGGSDATGANCIPPLSSDRVTGMDASSFPTNNSKPGSTPSSAVYSIPEFASGSHHHPYNSHSARPPSMPRASSMMHAAVPPHSQAYYDLTGEDASTGMARASRQGHGYH